MPAHLGGFRRSEIARRAAGVMTLLAVVLVICGVSGCGSGHAGAQNATACDSQVRDAVLPAWARGGFHPPTLRMPYVLGTSGKIVAIVFGYPLRSPPPKDHNNKILWVSHLAMNPGSDLRITAQRMTGKHAIGSPVKRAVMGGPGPSIIDLPSPGCWRLSLRWSGNIDRLDLQYE